MNILVTCPPMIGMLDRFEEDFEKLGWTVTAPEFEQTLSVEALVKLVPKFDGWIIGDDPATREVVENGRKGSLRAAVKWGVGTDNVDFQAFSDNKIPVTNTPGMFGNEVSDIALGYLIALARKTFEIHVGVKSGAWPKPAGISLAGKKVGLVGLGDIGRALLKRLNVLDMDVIAYDPFIDSETLAEVGPVDVQLWPDRLNDCEFLVFTCALTESNHHMLNEEVLEQVKPGLYVINVSRGPLIDEEALIKAMKNGVVAGAALDVFEVEPIVRSNSLFEFPQNIFGSHNASNTKDAVQRTSSKAIALLDNFLQET